MTKGREHLQEWQMAEQPGDDSRHRDHHQRVEAEREADDDQRDSEERPIP